MTSPPLYANQHKSPSSKITVPLPANTSLTSISTANLDGFCCNTLNLRAEHRRWSTCAADAAAEVGVGLNSAGSGIYLQCLSSDPSLSSEVIVMSKNESETPLHLDKCLFFKYI